MKSISKFVGALMLLVGATSVSAAELKVGVVDLQKIMQTSPQMKNIQQKLENDFKPRRDKLVNLEEGLKKDMEKLKRDSSILSQTEKKVLEKKIIAAQQSLERDGQQYQQELNAAHNEAMEELYTKIRKAINTIAEKEKYELVLQKDAVPFSMTALNITDKVLATIQ